MDKTVYVLLAAAVIIAIILVAIIHYFPQTGKVDKEKYQCKWLEIEHKLQPGNADSQQLAILNADKLLDAALKETGSKGSTMGERMKARQGVWSNANAVWAAHKLRNQIAHEDHISISDETVRRALASFKRALKDLGVM